MSAAPYVQHEDRESPHGDLKTSFLQRHKIVLIVTVFVLLAGTAFFFWAPSPSEYTGRCKGDEINVLQFNPHAECFIPKFQIGDVPCSGKVFDLVDNLLLGRRTYDFEPYSRFDFASIDYVGSSTGLVAPRGYNKTVHDCSAEGNGDDVTLLYNTERWTPIGQPRTGCLGPKDKNVKGYTRPFLVQPFKSSELDLKVLIVSAHFPHPADWPESHKKLKEVIADEVAKGVHKVMLIADTNFATKPMPFPDDLIPKSSEEIFGEIGVPHDNTQTTQGLLTCCQTVWFHTGYDRITANFGKHMNTDVGLSQAAAKGWAGRFMHLPMVGSLCLE